MNSNNNQHMLIQAVKDLRDRNMDIYLLLVGKDCLNGECQEEASKLQIQQFVRFLGMRNDTGELLAPRISMLLPARQKNVLWVLYRLNMLICLLQQPPTKDDKAVIKDGLNGFLVPADDAKTMADRILLLLEKPTTYKGMSQVDVSTYISKGVPVIDDDF